ncbi:MAG: amino acid permease [Ktedonobacteraceae bacterium]
MALFERSVASEGKTKTLLSERYVPASMPSVLGTFDMTAIYLAAIFFIGNAANTAGFGGVASLTFLLIGGATFFLPCVIATAQLGVLFPHEGSLYNWTCHALGDYWGFFVGTIYWVPNVLGIIGAADGLITYIQGLNTNWLTQPWQQGLAILAVLAFTTVLAVQRQRAMQNIVNVVIGSILVVVFLVGLSGVLWITSGHPSATPLNHVADWQVNNANFSIFGLIALLYLGVTIPMNMAGEIRNRKVIPRHLLWGTVLVMMSYIVCTLVPLVVRGPALAKASILPYEIVTLLDVVLGKAVGSICAVCILGFYLISPLVYSYANARLLFVAAIDQRLPRFLGRLNSSRVPANAIIFQSIIAGIIVVCIFMIAPSIAFLGKPADLATDVYNVLLAALTLILALSTIFLFIDLLILSRRDRVHFHQQRIFPMWMLWLCMVVGSIACLTVVVNTLQNSWIPQLISNSQWLLVIGIIILVTVTFTAIGAMLASSQTSWETWEQ